MVCLCIKYASVCVLMHRMCLCVWCAYVYGELMCRCASFSKEFIQPGQISFSKIHVSIINLSEKIVTKKMTKISLELNLRFTD